MLWVLISVSDGMKQIPINRTALDLEALSYGKIKLLIDNDWAASWQNHQNDCGYSLCCGYSLVFPMGWNTFQSIGLP